MILMMATCKKLLVPWKLSYAGVRGKVDLLILVRFDLDQVGNSYSFKHLSNP